MEENNYTKDELLQEFIKYYTDPNLIVTAACGIFTMIYGKYVVDVYSPVEFIEAANKVDSRIKVRYSAELNAAFAMYRHFRDNPEKLRRVACGESKEHFSHLDISHQVITYGAPGTGKSFSTDRETKGKVTFRTTFHPDSDYSTFVGSYKPTRAIDPYETVVKVGTQNGGNIIQQDRLVRKSEISYDFVPQAFIRAYVAAWKKYAARLAAGGALTDDDRVYLVIEEINRGHCAQIFGDLFQLLDRNEAGFSDYPIDADVDLAKWLHAQFAADDFGDEFKAIKGYEEDGKLVLKLCLPPNLFIRATMNTSDQSLFPMDSAFKRRWDWRYVPISEPDKGDEPDFNKRKVLCKLGGENKLERRFDWWEFLKVVNAAILHATKSEDKQLGYFFVKVPNNPGEISAEKFAGKVLFYLYNDVFKDYNYPDAVFAKKNQPAGGPKVKYSFKDFFDAKGRAKDAMVAEFLENLGIPSEEKQLPA